MSIRIINVLVFFSFTPATAFRLQVFIAIDFIVMISGIYRIPLDNSLVAECTTLSLNGVHFNLVRAII